MYAQVVVLTYQSPDIDAYTYEIPKNLEKEIKIGQLVSVPFGKRNPQGVVVVTSSQRPETSTEIKDIKGILTDKPLLLPFQIELLKWMNFYYHAPMVNCLKAMLPEIPRKLNNYQAHPRGELSSSSAHPGDEQFGQTVVLVPSINRIPETLAQYPQAKNYVIYHNELAMSERFALWQKIMFGNVDFVLGSRSAIFTPSPNLKKIIIYDEHEGAYKDERSPYYDTLTIADKIKQLTGCRLEIIDTAPKVTTYFNHNTHLRRVRTLQGEESDKLPKVQFVSMLSEKAAGNRSPISSVLEEYIKKGLFKNKKILLFLNKKTESGHVYCKSCKYSDFAKTQPETCPNCASPDIFFSSLNINSLKLEVKKIVPEGIGEIDIATAAVFYKMRTYKYDLVAHVRADSALNIQEYTATESLYRQITDLKKITRGLLLLQTYNPENETLNAAANGNYQKFYKAEIALRKTLNYPPFALLIKLSKKGRKEDALEESAQRLYDELKLSIVNGQLSIVSILGPFKPMFVTRYAKYNIILKVPINSYSLSEREKTLATLEPLLEKVPRDWQIEIDPETIND